MMDLLALRSHLTNRRNASILGLTCRLLAGEGHGNL